MDLLVVDVKTDIQNTVKFSGLGVVREKRDVKEERCAKMVPIL